MKKLYAEVERLIRRKVGAPRASSQTAGDYTSFAANRSPELDDHISWFKQAVWRAAYRSGDLQPEMITDGRVRLALFKKAFQESFNDSGRQQASVRS